MSTIADVRETEKKLEEILGTMKDAAAHDLDRLGTLLRNITDDYAAAIRELEFNPLPEKPMILFQVSVRRYQK